jgi:hypothetical protein
LFLTEDSMIPLLRQLALARMVRSDELWIALPQHQLGTRVPDLVLARLDASAVSARLSAGLLRPLSWTEVQIVRSVRTDSGTTLERLASTVPASKTHILRLVRRLVLEGFLEKTAQGYSRHAATRPMATRVISFEAKRADWKRALLQARAHREFAHETYVAFDSTFETRFKRAVPHYSSAGVGLIALSEPRQSGTLVMKSRAHRRGHPLPLVWAGETIWRRLVDDSATPSPRARFPNEVGETSRLEGRLLVGLPPNTLVRFLSGLESVEGRDPLGQPTHSQAVRTTIGSADRQRSCPMPCPL